jgi:hypothetical protein
MKRRLLLLPALLLSLPLQAQLSPVTPQQRVDSGRDREAESVAVAMAPDGSHTVIWTYWQSEGSSSCEATAMYARRFDGEGRPLGPPVAAVRSERLCIGGLKIGPPVQGRQLVAWVEWYGKYGPTDYLVGTLEPSGRVRRLRRFDGANVVALVPLRSGGFLLVNRQAKGDRRELQGRRFDAAGRPLGRGFTILSGGKVIWWVDAVDTAGGGLAITWVEYDSATERYAMRARALRADGRPLSGVLAIGEDQIEMQAPRIASDGSGRFAILWSAVDPEVSRFVTVVQGRFYEADGMARTPVLTLTPASDWFRYVQDVAMGDEGELVPVWRLQADTYDNGASLVDADGHTIDLIEPLTDRPEGYQMDSAVATDGHGRWVVAWTWLGEGGEGPGIYTRLFTSQP